MSMESKKTQKQVPLNNITKMMHGKVKWFDVRKGIGFITADDGSEHFIYYSNISAGRTYTGFEQGDEVNFRVKLDPNTGRQQAVSAMLVFDDEDKLNVDAETAQKILSSKCVIDDEDK